MSPLAKYLLWQVPGWLAAGALLLWLALAGALPAGLAVVLIVAWIAKDLALFPAMRTVFSPAAKMRPIGARAEAVERLAPSGYVRVDGELWQARTRGTIVEPGRPVIVCSASGLTLIVEEEDRPGR